MLIWHILLLTLFLHIVPAARFELQFLSHQMRVWCFPFPVRGTWQFRTKAKVLLHHNNIASWSRSHPASVWCLFSNVAYKPLRSGVKIPALEGHLWFCQRARQYFRVRWTTKDHTFTTDAISVSPGHTGSARPFALFVQLCVEFLHWYSYVKQACSFLLCNNVWEVSLSMLCYLYKRNMNALKTDYIGLAELCETVQIWCILGNRCALILSSMLTDLSGFFSFGVIFDN